MEEQDAYKRAQEAVRQMEGGCSALAWETEDEKHLWGRNFDFNRIAADSKVTYLPRETKFYTCGCELEKSIEESTLQSARYGAVGIGTTVLQSTPVLYEGVNEKGLAGGQLYYREFAAFQREKEKGKLPVQPPFLVTYLLTACASAEEAARVLKEKISLFGAPLLGAVPSIHWIFTDRTGESIVVEPDRDGVKIYRNTLGIMTNSPGYEWHKLNLLNYSHIRDLDYESLDMGKETLPQCFSGSGAAGIPGSWASPSRFVRLAYLKKYGIKGKGEAQGVTNLFHLLKSAAFPLGIVRVGEQGDLTKYDKEVVPYDYTVYTAVMCLESLRFYWTTYRNLRVQYVDLKEFLELKKIFQLDLDFTEDFKNRGRETLL